MVSATSRVTESMEAMPAMLGAQAGGRFSIPARVHGGRAGYALRIKSQQEAVNITVTGPYQSNRKGQLPSADLAFKVEGGKQDFQGKLISTGKNAFVEYQGETYEVGDQAIAQLRKQGESQQFSTADLSKLMGTMSDWFPESEAQDAELGGEPVDRVTGKLDLSRALKDLKAFAEKSGASGAEGLKQLSNGDINEIEDSVSDPKFTIDVAKSDGKLRRVQASMNVKDSSDSGSVTSALLLTESTSRSRSTLRAPAGRSRNCCRSCSAPLTSTRRSTRRSASLTIAASEASARCQPVLIVCGVRSPRTTWFSVTIAVNALIAGWASLRGDVAGGVALRGGLRGQQRARARRRCPRVPAARHPLLRAHVRLIGWSAELGGPAESRRAQAPRRNGRGRVAA